MEQAKTVKKIAVLTTWGRQPLLIQAVYIDGLLTMDMKKPLPKQGDKLAAVVTPMLTKLVNAGFTVLVDEVSGQLSAATGANPVSVDMKHHDGRPVIVVAMERFQELQRLSMISFAQGEETQFNLPRSLVDTEMKPNGESVYRVNWDEMKGEHLLTLFCVYATIYNNTTSAAYLTALCGAIRQDVSPLAPLKNIINRTETQVLNQKHSTSSLTGKRLPNGDKVL
jgi:hypothetical protein